MSDIKKRKENTQLTVKKKKRSNLSLFISIWEKLSHPVILYYKIGTIIFPLFVKNVKLRDLKIKSVLLTMRSMFLIGLKRDVLRLSLFLYKLAFFWDKFFFDDIVIANKLKATFLRSVFADNTAKLQYEVVTYECKVQISFENIWGLFYFFSTLRTADVVQYSQISMGYSITSGTKSEDGEDNDVKNQ